MAEQKVVPLSASVQAARGYLKDAIAQIMDHTHLPPYLMDGVVSEALAELRHRELCDYAMTSGTPAPEPEEGGDSK